MLIEPYRFEIFKDQNIIHAYSNRIGGYSSGNFKSLNLGLSTRDSFENVRKNRKKFFPLLQVNERSIAFPQQIHSDNITIVTAPGIIKESDALITNIPGIILSIQTADCFPVFLLDFKKRVCAIVHSGWRGTEKNISGKAVEKMKDSFGCKEENLLIAIGPGIQQENYQVDSKTANCFESNYLKSDGPDHYKLDVQSKIIDQLLDHNISLSQIEVDKRCTFANPELFFSYRRDGIDSGRMMGLVGLLK